VGGGTLNARRNSAKAPSLACVPGDPECRLDVNDWPCFNLNAMELCMKSVFTASVVCTSREISCSSFQPILPRPMRPRPSLVSSRVPSPIIVDCTGSCPYCWNTGSQSLATCTAVMPRRTLERRPGKPGGGM